MSWRERFGGTGWLNLVLFLGLASCALGIVLAVVLDKPAHGQRGGAVAVTLAFLMLFLGRDTAAWALTGKIGEGASRRT